MNVHDDGAYHVGIPSKRGGAFVVREAVAELRLSVDVRPIKQSVFVATALPELRLSFDARCIPRLCIICARPHSISRFSPTIDRREIGGPIVLYCRVAAGIPMVVSLFLLRHFSVI